MSAIPRLITESILNRIGSNKVLLLYGTRRVGKTMLLNHIAERQARVPLILNGEDLDTQQALGNRTSANYKRLLGGHKLLLVDEAQNVPGIGQHLKFMIDTFKELTIIATGSSSFDLMNRSGEPLTGRSYAYTLYPISQGELLQHAGGLGVLQQLDERLIFGSYPEVISMEYPTEKEIYLKTLVQNYLLKDIFIYETIKNSSKIFDLLRLLARQVGSEVSMQELGRTLGMSKNTVERYLDLLTKVFIIFRMGGFSSNLRKEVTKSQKWYFFDNGIRNALIGDFRSLEQRSDVGQLWENFCVYERIKHMRYAGSMPGYYFWRTYDGQEVDMVERNGVLLNAFEFKYKPTKKLTPPKYFRDNYPDAGYSVVHRENYMDHLVS